MTPGKGANLLSFRSVSDLTGVNLRRRSRVKPQPASQSVVRGVQDGAYNRLAGNPDTAAPYSSDPLPEPSTAPGVVLHPDHDLHR